MIDIRKTYLQFSGLMPRNITDCIVIHHTGSGIDLDYSAEEIHDWHIEAGWAGIGYHFVVRKSGIVERGRPLWAVGSHAAGENYHSIGIHLSGDFNIGSPTAAQIESTARLVNDLCAEYDLPIDRRHILGHRELMSTDCPGKNLYDLLDVIAGKANWYRFN